MYDAALESIDTKLAVSKKYGTIIRRFGEHVVVGKQLDRRLSKILNAGEDTRLFADCARHSVEPAAAVTVLSEMDEFMPVIATIAAGTYP
jgi:hypothetical protein